MDGPRISNTPTDAEAVWAAERALLRPDVRHDETALRTLLSPDFREFGQSGRAYDRDQMIAALLASPAEDVPVHLSEQATLPVGSDAVLLTYLLGYGGRLSRRSSLWRCADGDPRLVFHQGTAVGG